MKQIAALLLAVLLPCSALAQEVITANGVVQSATIHEITAPYTGVLLPFDWKSGESVLEDELLFAMDTFKVYAPASGTVGAVFAQQGDLAAEVEMQYGMIASIEKTNGFQVDCSTSGAYNDDENRIIHTGERIYIEQTNDKDNVGEGRVISVNGSKYMVEMTDGDFEDGDSVKIYRDDKMTSKSCIGSGKVLRAADVSVYGTGRLVQAAVEEGDRVRKGQLMFEMASQDADASLESAAIHAPADGALELAAASGQQVYKGMVLAKIHDLSEMNVVASVDEMDLDLIVVGDSLKVALDRYPGVEFSGIVTEIAKIGIPKQNATYYDVTLALDARQELLPGMNAIVTLSK